jgi:uncharacterized Zn-binding protein involved in type VI secretion
VGQPAAVAGDKVQATCASHLIPNPATGVPQPSPPLPFSAPLTIGLSTTVLIADKPAAVVGAQGFNLPPHVGLHPTDPAMAPPVQMATVTKGSTSVMIDKKPAARTGDTATVCLGLPVGSVLGTAGTVLIGG